MDFTGKITFISKKETVGSNAIPKITFVLEETDQQYPNTVACDLLGDDKIAMLSSFSVGDSVTVGLNFKSNESNGRHFNSIRARKIQSANGEEQTQKSVPQNTSAKNNTTKNNDDLPF